MAAGFRGIDTANQRRHYHEAAVGDAIRKSGESLFVQTKFTYVESQDHRLPYDPNAGYPTQVRQSFESSIQHLGHVDSYLLHGPRTHSGISSIDREVWRTMEDLQREGRTSFIGISNVTADQLAELCDIASVRPAFVQNRCFARLGWDRDVRQVARREGVAYQGFSLLTANVPELASPTVRGIAAAHDTNVTRVAFAFALAVGMICLTGTTSPEHMRDDLTATELELSEVEIATIEEISERRLPAGR
ncbi:MAG: aldo/keto reductase [Acidobacteriota bacterium]|nr:aldo/keto reductase [Acidobacteriota bacterium]